MMRLGRGRCIHYIRRYTRPGRTWTCSSHPRRTSTRPRCSRSRNNRHRHSSDYSSRTLAGASGVASGVEWAGRWACTWAAASGVASAAASGVASGRLALWRRTHSLNNRSCTSFRVRGKYNRRSWSSNRTCNRSTSPGMHTRPRWPSSFATRPGPLSPRIGDGREVSIRVAVINAHIGTPAARVTNVPAATWGVPDVLRAAAVSALEVRLRLARASLLVSPCRPL